MLAELAARTFYEAFASANTPENMQAYISEAFTVSQLSAEISDPGATFLIAEVDGSPQGYAKLYAGEAPPCIDGPSPVEISRIYIDQTCLGTGLGPALMQACLDEARRAGHQVIFLGVWERNLRAQAFYRKWGFEKVGDHVFQMGDDPQNDWIMMRRL